MKTLVTNARRARTLALRFASITLLAALAGCGSAGEDLGSTKNAFSGRGPVDGNVAAFKALDATTVYVLGTDGKLWRESGDSSNRTLVDANVADFQPLDGYTVFVRGTDGRLWREYGSDANRQLVDANVAEFQAVNLSFVYVKGTDNRLWRETGDYHNRYLVDANVKSFQAIDSEVVYVLGTDSFLWNETGTSANRFEVDSNVSSYYAVDSTNVYVRGSDATLWNEHGTAGNRSQVDANVAKFYPLDDQTIYVQGGDTKLWREVSSFQFRDYVDANAKAFQPIGTETVYVLGSDGNLWREQMPGAPIVLSSSLQLLNASSSLGIWPNGNYIFAGNMSASSAVGLNDALAWAVRASDGEVYTFVHQGSIAACWPWQSNSDDFTTSGTNPALASGFSAIQAGYQWNMRVVDSWDLGALWNELSSAWGYAQKVISVVGAVLGG